jgi:uncharacterized protein
MTDSKTHDLAVIIFIKNKVLGKVKTRLAHTMGAEKALEVYTELLEITRRTALDFTQADRHVFYSDHIEQRDNWSEPAFTKHQQLSDHDLGARMQTAFEQLFAAGYKKLMIIGSDCPTISTEVLENAFSALAETDFVVGPSTDGGYYLLGMNVPEPKITDRGFVFRNMTWSTSEVLNETLARITAYNQTYSLLTALTDIDEEADWWTYKNAQSETH